MGKLSFPESKYITITIDLIRTYKFFSDLFRRLVHAWILREMEDMHDQNIIAVKEAFEKNDQIQLERMLGNPSPGDFSNMPGIFIRMRKPPSDSN